MSRLIIPFDQYSDDAGNPLINGQLHFFEVGSTTLKDTFADAGRTIPNTNPVLLSGSGRAPNIYGSGTYRVTLSDSEGGQIEERDNVGAIASGSSSSGGYGADWDSGITYNVPNVVLFDGLYYESRTNSNIGNTPDTNPTNWLEGINAGFLNGKVGAEAGTPETIAQRGANGELTCSETLKVLASAGNSSIKLNDNLGETRVDVSWDKASGNAGIKLNDNTGETRVDVHWDSATGNAQILVNDAGGAPLGELDFDGLDLDVNGDLVWNNGNCEVDLAGAEGFQKLGSGLIFQWGTASPNPAGITVTFPIAFPNSVRHVYPINGSGDPSTLVGADTKTQTNFKMYSSGINEFHTYYAIGS